jgi:hypoxanthine phosphoribosyltransferase
VIGGLSVDNYILSEEFYCRLGIARSSMKLYDLAKMLGLDSSVVSKYIHGVIEPSNKKKRILLDKLRSFDYIQPLSQCISSSVYPFPETNNILHGCPHLIHCVLYEAMVFMRELNPDIIFTIEGGGLSIASILHYLTKAKVVYGLRDVIVSGGHSVSSNGSSLDTWNPRVKRYITFPMRSKIIGENALIIDDIAWTGNTCITIYKYIKKKFNVKGVFLIASFESALKRIYSEVNVPVKSIIVFPDSYRVKLQSLAE